MLEHIQQAETACCGPKNRDCQKGMPAKCSIACAVNFHGMYRHCGLLLHAMLPPKDLKTYSHFDGLCTSSMNIDTKAVLRAISGATCARARHSGHSARNA
jgi:hypothetical protein